MSTASNFAALDTDEQKRLLDKLAKLKALSECQTGNVNETATAAATMTRIMLEYQIEIADLEAGSPTEDAEVLTQSVYPEDSFNGYPMWKNQLLSAIARVNHCKSFGSSRPEYELWTRRTRSRLCLIGSSRDIENALRLYFFCAEEIERLCRAWGTGQGVKRKNDFKRGASSGIADKVVEEHDRVIRETVARAQRENQTSHALDLFDRKDRAVARAAADLGIVTQVVRRRQPQRDAYSDGYTAGASLDLGRGSRPGLPPARG